MAMIPIEYDEGKLIQQASTDSGAVTTTANIWKSTSAVIQIPSDGLYLLIGNGCLQNTASDEKLIAIGETNSTHSTFTAIIANVDYSTRAQSVVSTLRNCTAGEYISVGGRSASAANLNYSPATIRAYKLS